ncbi:UTRA domain-containing protein [Sphingomonas tabacisoli]|uniref:UTRA domain-containing protein n=1 Tax=Sphingomonas tabacisoli TaxID=2249466 RepID=A0ABW4I0F4_9SPHN
MTIEQRIRTEIASRIQSGEWRPGDRVPFEHELVARYGCSRATVSKALGALAKAGLIERRRKAGSFVAQPQVHSAVLEIPDLAQLIEARGETYRWEKTVSRPGRATDSDFPQPFLWVEGIHFEGGHPFALERRAISLLSVPEAEHEDFAQIAPGTWLLRHIPWTSARHRIRAIPADRHDADPLDLPSGSACLELSRTTWRAGELITSSRQLFPGDRFDLVAEFKPSAHVN